MPNINDLSIKQIDEECGISLNDNQVMGVLKNVGIINKYKNKFEEIDDMKELVKFLEQYEKYVDKEQLIFAIYEYKKNHKESFIEYNKEEYERNMQNIEKYIKELGNKEVGYTMIDIEMLENENIELKITTTSLGRDVYHKELTTKEEMKNLINKLSSETINRLLKDNLINHNSIYNAPNTGQAIYEFVNKTELIDTFIKLGGIKQVIQNIFVTDAYDIDIKKMCLMSFYKLQRRMENGAFEEKNREMYSKMLKELYNVLRGRKIKIILEDGSVYTSQDVEKKAKQFCNEKFYTMEDIESIIKDLIENGTEIKREYRRLIKDYIDINNRKMKNASEFKLVYKYIFNKEKIISMYLNGQIHIENIKQAIAEDGSIQLVTDKEFINNYKLVQNKAKNKMLSNKEKENNSKIQDLYVQSNLLGEKRDEHIETILEKLNSQEDIEYLLKNSIINEEDIIKYTLKKVINRDVFMQLYLSEKIHLETIKSIVQDNQKDFDIKEIIDEDELMKKIIVNKKAKNQKKDTEIRKLALLYKTLLVDKTEKEKEELANEFVMNLEIKLEEKKMQINSEDRIYLYEIGIIPIDTVIYWGDNNEIIKLLNKGIVNCKDIKQLYQKNIINDDILTKTIMSNDISNVNKINLINIVYLEDKEKRNKMLQKLQFDTEYKKSNIKSARTISQGKSTYEEDVNDKTKYNEKKKYVFDSAIRYNSMLLADDDAIVECFSDGHVAIHLPNINGGIVLIEQLYVITKSDIVKEKYGSATFIMSEYEYINRKSEFVTIDDKIDRLKLRSLEKENICQRQVHSKGKWIKEMQKILGVPEELLQQKEIEKIDGLEQSYTQDEIEKLVALHNAWIQVQNSREEI